MSLGLLFSLGGRKASKEIIIADVIEIIRLEISEVYKDIALSHFSSASQAIMASSSSHNSDQEIRNAIAHLRDAFNIINSLLHKKIKKKFLIFESEIDAIENRRDRMTLNIDLCKISAIVSILYSEFGENKNASEWKEKSIRSFDIYFNDELGEKENWLFLNDKGKMIDTDNVYNNLSEKEYDKYIFRCFFASTTGYYKSYLELTDKGKSFVLNLRKKQRMELLQLFNN